MSDTQFITNMGVMAEGVNNCKPVLSKSKWRLAKNHFEQ